MGIGLNLHYSLDAIAIGKAEVIFPENLPHILPSGAKVGVSALDFLADFMDVSHNTLHPADTAIVYPHGVSLISKFIGEVINRDSLHIFNSYKFRCWILVAYLALSIPTYLP